MLKFQGSDISRVKDQYILKFSFEASVDLEILEKNFEHFWLFIYFKYTQQSVKMLDFLYSTKLEKKTCVNEMK